MQDTSKAQIKKFAYGIAKGQDAQADAMDQAEVRRLYDQLKARKGSGDGWHLVADKGPHGEEIPLPMHQLTFKSPPTADVVRQHAETMPLLCRIIKYGEMEWWEARSPVYLTDEELDSASVYRDLYEQKVAAGEVPPRAIKETDPGDEPSGGELYRIAKAIKAGLDKFPYPSTLQRRASILYTALKDGGTASQVLDAAFRFHEGPSILFVLAEMAAVVPEVGRLVTWLEKGEAA